MITHNTEYDSGPFYGLVPENFRKNLLLYEAWLARYIILWDRNVEQHDDRHHNWLCDIYTDYIQQAMDDSNPLECVSAEDNLLTIIRVLERN